MRDTSPLQLMLLAGVMAVAHATTQAPYFYTHPTNDVTVTCLLSAFKTEYPSEEDISSLEIVQFGLDQNVSVAQLDVINGGHRVADTDFAGEVFRVDGKKTPEVEKTWLTLTLVDVEVQADRPLSYGCLVAYSSKPIRYWDSERVRFKPFNLFGPEAVEHPGINVTVHQGLFFDCTYRANKVSPGELTFEYSGTTPAEQVCPRKNDDGTAERSGIRCYSHPTNGTASDWFWLQAFMLNASCSEAEMCKCKFRPPGTSAASTSVSVSLLFVLLGAYMSGLTATV